MYNSRIVPYLSCAGVKDNNNNVIVENHYIQNGSLYFINSHQLCPDCDILTKYIGKLYRGLTEEQKFDCKLFLKHYSNKSLTHLEDVFLTRKGGMLERLTE